MLYNKSFVLPHLEAQRPFQLQCQFPVTLLQAGKTLHLTRLIRISGQTGCDYNFSIALLPFCVSCTCLSQQKMYSPRISEHWSKRKFKKKKKDIATVSSFSGRLRRVAGEPTWHAGPESTERMDKLAVVYSFGNGSVTKTYHSHNQLLEKVLQPFQLCWAVCFRKPPQRGTGTLPGYWHQSSSAHSKTRS